MGFIYFSSLLGCPPRFKNFPQTHQCEGFLVFGNFLYYMTPFPGRVFIPNSFVCLFIFYILFYLPSKTMGCFSGHLMSSASDQKLFCGVCSAFKCSFDKFVGEKVVSQSYSSAILAPPPRYTFLKDNSDFSVGSGGQDKRMLSNNHILRIYSHFKFYYYTLGFKDKIKIRCSCMSTDVFDSVFLF